MKYQLATAGLLTCDRTDCLPILIQIVTSMSFDNAAHSSGTVQDSHLIPILITYR